jgi:hypothetical protein
MNLTTFGQSCSVMLTGSAAVVGGAYQHYPRRYGRTHLRVRSEFSKLFSKVKNPYIFSKVQFEKLTYHEETLSPSLLWLYTPSGKIRIFKPFRKSKTLLFF